MVSRRRPCGGFQAAGPLRRAGGSCHARQQLSTFALLRPALSTTKSRARPILVSHRATGGVRIRASGLPRMVEAGGGDNVNRCAPGAERGLPASLTTHHPTGGVSDDDKEVRAIVCVAGVWTLPYRRVPCIMVHKRRWCEAIPRGVTASVLAHDTQRNSSREECVNTVKAFKMFHPHAAMCCATP